MLRERILNDCPWGLLFCHIHCHHFSRRYRNTHPASCRHYSYRLRNSKCLKTLFNIAIIHQNPYVFHTSVRHNLTLYQDYSDSLLISTLKKVGLWEACCHQLDYELTGDNFSGGQIIKLEIARAILREKQVLLADEMMASLDEASSKEISNVLKQLPNSIIEIAHHYNLEDYDAVYRIENKSIVRIK